LDYLAVYGDISDGILWQPTHGLAHLERVVDGDFDLTGRLLKFGYSFQSFMAKIAGKAHELSGCATEKRWQIFNFSPSPKCLTHTFVVQDPTMDMHSFRSRHTGWHVHRPFEPRVSSKTMSNSRFPLSANDICRVVGSFAVNELAKQSSGSQSVRRSNSYSTTHFHQLEHPKRLDGSGRSGGNRCCASNVVDPYCDNCNATVSSIHRQATASWNDSDRHHLKRYVRERSWSRFFEPTRTQNGAHMVYRKRNVFS
jgi:hypothetical protein